MSYDTPLSPQGQAISSLPMREQLRRGFKDMGSRSYSSAKNFGLVGAVFAGTECVIESVSFAPLLGLVERLPVRFLSVINFLRGENGTGAAPSERLGG